MMHHCPCPAWLAAVLAFVWAAPVVAEDRPPPLRLTQDVAITYRVTTAGMNAGAGIEPRSPAGQLLQGMPAVQTRILRQAATGRTRAGDDALAEILDARGQKHWTFSPAGRPPQGRTVLLREGDLAGMDVEAMGQDPDTVAERRGDDRVAGTPCTVWQLRGSNEPEAEAILACIAADGLVLRTARRSGPMTEVQEALRIEYGPLDPALFTPPPGWPVRREP